MVPLVGLSRFVFHQTRNEATLRRQHPGVTVTVHKIHRPADLLVECSSTVIQSPNPSRTIFPRTAVVSMAAWARFRLVALMAP